MNSKLLTKILFGVKLSNLNYNTALILVQNKSFELRQTAKTQQITLAAWVSVGDILVESLGEEDGEGMSNVSNFLVPV